MAPRTLIFCISEMSPMLVARWKDDLPTLSALQAKGVAGHTRYSVPYYLTPQMWATIHTGVGAGKHGLFDYRQRDGTGAFQETRGSDIAAPVWWNYLHQAGRAAGIVNLPLTYPPLIGRGFMISGQDAPGDHPSIMEPQTLWHEMSAQFGRYHLKDVFPGGQDKAQYARLLQDELVRQTEVYTWLAARKDWEVIALYTSVVAMAQHYFWDTIDANQTSPVGDLVKQIFVGVDKMLARVIEASGSNLNVCVVSECGAGPLASGVNLNAALRDAGLLTFKGQSPNARRAERKVLTWIRETAQRRLPKSLFYAANQSGFRRWLLNRMSNNGIDWSLTRAYHRGKGEGNIYFNIKGREPFGVVDPADVPVLRQEVTAALMALTAPNGEKPILAVHTREALFDGPHLEAAPDLVIEWRDAAFMPTERNSETEPVFGERWREYMRWPTSGSHRPNGVFIAAGPSIAKRDQMEVMRLIDLAPFWLALAGVSAPPHMEGHLRQDLLANAAESVE